MDIKKLKQSLGKELRSVAVGTVTAPDERPRVVHVTSDNYDLMKKREFIDSVASTCGMRVTSINSLECELTEK